MRTQSSSRLRGAVGLHASELAGCEAVAGVCCRIGTSGPGVPRVAGRWQGPCAPSPSVAAAEPVSVWRMALVVHPMLKRRGARTFGVCFNAAGLVIHFRFGFVSELANTHDDDDDDGVYDDDDDGNVNHDG